MSLVFWEVVNTVSVCSMHVCENVLCVNFLTHSVMPMKQQLTCHVILNTGECFRDNF